MDQHPEAGPAAPRTNPWGLAGFIVSLVGLCGTAGILSPIGLILSLIGVGREPRGFAIAGIVIGALGSCGIIITLLVLPFVVMGLLLAAGASAAALTVAGVLAAFGFPEVEAQFEMALIAERIEEYQDQNGVLPASLADLPPAADPAAREDPWGRPYVYEINPDPTQGGQPYSLYSLGPDGQPDTADDIEWDPDLIDVDIDRNQSSTSGPSTPSAPAPATP